MLGTTLGDVDVFNFSIVVGTKLDSLSVSFDCSNYGKMEVPFLGDSLRSTDGRVFGSDEGIKMGLSYGKVFGIVLVNVDRITLNRLLVKFLDLINA